jgi:hypothetical protein
MHCRTSQTEDLIIRDLETEFGKIRVPQRDVDFLLDREKKHARRVNRSRRSLLKTFQQREKARMIQHIVENRNNKSADKDTGHHQVQARSSISGTENSYAAESEREVVFNEIELDY